MTSSNLAVVFGPTLTRSPPGSEEFALSASPCINTVMQTCIDHFDQIFEAVEEPRDEDDGGNENEANMIVRGSLSDDDYPSEMDSEGFYSDEAIEAIAIHDYEARSGEEVSFHKGQSVFVLQQTDDGNWWDGFVGSKRGYIPTQYVEIVLPFDRPKPSQNSLAVTEESSFDEPADKRPTDIGDLKVPTPPVTVMVSESNPNTPVTNEELVDNADLPPPPFPAAPVTDPVDESYINDAMETLNTAISDLENLVSVSSNEQQLSENTGKEQEGDLEKEEEEWNLELPPVLVETTEDEASTKQPVEIEIPSPPPTEEQEEQSSQVEKRPFKRSSSPVPKLPSKPPPHIGSKPFRPIGRPGQLNTIQPSPATLSQPSMISQSQSADNIFIQIKGARGANQKDTKEDVTSPTGPHPAFPKAPPASIAQSKPAPKKAKPTGPGMHPKAPPPVLPKKPGIGGLASQIKAQADAIRLRSTFGKKEDDPASNNTRKGDFVDEPGITHL
jgi:hypothetical protein